MRGPSLLLVLRNYRAMWAVTATITLYALVILDWSLSRTKEMGPVQPNRFPLSETSPIIETCLNDAQALYLASRNHLPKAYATVLSTPVYLQGALTLFSAFQHSNSTISTFLILVTPEINETLRGNLTRAGMTVVPVPHVEPPKGNQHQPYLQTAFAKLNLWNMTEYSSLLYLDTDILILQNLDDLFTHPANDYAQVLACRDLPLINSGVMILHPNAKVYDMMRRGVREAWFISDKADQGFSSFFFQNHIYYISPIYNMLNLRWDLWSNRFHIQLQDNNLDLRESWNKGDPSKHLPGKDKDVDTKEAYKLEEVKLVHFVSVPKPWIACNWRLYLRYGELYSKYWAEMRAARDAWPEAFPDSPCSVTEYPWNEQGRIR